MKLKKDSSDQKLRGAYYTPGELADKMVQLFDFSTIKTILEPSCGDGEFLRALKRNNVSITDKDIVAVEFEPTEAEKVKKEFKNDNSISVICDDYLKFYEESKEQKAFDLIIGNPPYVRYQYMIQSQRDLLSEIIKENGMKPNKLINLWVCFVVSCTKLLSENGKLAFVIPAELLQVAYAEDLRLFLSNQFSKITLITFETLVFPDIEQEVVVFIGEKGKQEKGIRIIEMHDLNDFSQLSLDDKDFIPLNHVKEKWTRYFTTQEEIKLLDSLKNDERFKPFSKFGLINVGITTGDNNYFSIDKECEEEYQLSEVLLPLIGRSSHAHGVYFTPEDFQLNIGKGKKSKLLNLPDIPYEDYSEGVKRYIEKGEREEINKGYKCEIRDRWYIVPSVWIPDAFFLRRNNLYPKFVINKCNAVSTDTMHRIKFNKGIDPDVVLISYYNSVSFAFTEICGRSYGGGVLEILPGEVGNILLPVVNNISKKEIKSLVSRIDDVVRNDLNIEIALDLVDREVLIDKLGVDPEICNKTRSIWKKMQKRRLGRS